MIMTKIVDVCVHSGRELEVLAERSMGCTPVTKGLKLLTSSHGLSTVRCAIIHQEQRMLRSPVEKSEK